MMEKEIRKLFAEHPEILYGFTDISYCSYKESYRSALVFAVPYGEQLSPEDYTEERFEQGIQTAKGRLETVVAEIEQILQKHQVKYWIPPVAQENETELRALFSFKTAAARAGIGWFGKNDVIITERYGPRVRLSAILIDEIFAYGQPITAGRCPDDCTKCIDICPRHLIDLIPYDATCAVSCKSQDMGKLVNQYCGIGCIACHICEKNCPAGAITVENNVAHIDQQKCTHCGTCVEKCPKKAIKAL